MSSARTVSLMAILLLAAACTAPPRPVGRMRPVAPAVPAAPRSEAKLVRPVDEDAGRAWLDREIERAPSIEPPQPIVEAVEPPPDPNWRQYGYGYDYGYDYRYGHGYRAYPRGPTFPIHTAIGAGIGAAIGRRSGHRHRGAWIGGSIGFLFDLAHRW